MFVLLTSLRIAINLLPTIEYFTRAVHTFAKAPIVVLSGTLVNGNWTWVQYVSFISRVLEYLSHNYQDRRWGKGL